MAVRAQEFIAGNLGINKVLLCRIAQLSQSNEMNLIILTAKAQQEALTMKTEAERSKHLGRN